MPNLLAISLTLLPSRDALVLVDNPVPAPPSEALTDGLAGCDAAVVFPVTPAVAAVVADVLGTTLERRSLVVPVFAAPGPDEVEDRSMEARLFVAVAVLVAVVVLDTDDLGAVRLFSSLASPAFVVADDEAASRWFADVTPIAVVRLVLADTGGLVGGLLRLLPAL